MRQSVQPDPPMRVKASKKALVKMWTGGVPAARAAALAAPAGIRMFSSTEKRMLGPCTPKNQESWERPV